MAAPLASKVVIVTGGATGIGRAVADRVVSDGGAVVIGGRRRDTGERAARQLREAGGRALFIAADVTVEREVERLVAAAVAEFGRLDGAVNNAGGVNASGPVHTVDGPAWHADLEQNLTSVFYCLKYQIPAMIASPGGGSIINNASIGGVRGIPGLAPYVAAKHGVVGLTRAFSNELAIHGIRVNSVHPTGVSSEGMGIGGGAAAGPLFAADQRMQLNGLNMLPDLDAGPDAPYGPVPVITPREISNAVLFLASDEARYITGVALPVDAGNTNKP